MPPEPIAAPTLTSWPSGTPEPSEAELEALLREDGLSPRWWSNAPGDRYGAHSHPYHKLLYCIRGSIRFLVEPGGQQLDLSPGDRLDIPPGVTHSALVGRQGVACVEAARP